RRSGRQVEMPARVQPLLVTSDEHVSETTPPCSPHHPTGTRMTRSRTGGEHQSADAKCLIAKTCFGRDARPSQALLPSSAGILDKPSSARSVLATQNMALGLVWGQAT